MKRLTYYKERCLASIYGQMVREACELHRILWVPIEVCSHTKTKRRYNKKYVFLALISNKIISKYIGIVMLIKFVFKYDNKIK